MKPLAPNTMIQGRYLVVHLIGKGGMGEVYLAVDQRLGSAVALKRTSFADDESLAAAFEREAKILARLRHPVLPKVSDHFAEDGELYLIMEHISGDDLSKRLETAGKPFPVSWVMFWADQLLDALSYLHSHEPPIIHRDIKPQNLKLTDENHIILLDFGLSKDTANKAMPSKPGTSGSVVGYTPHFAPMEQIRGTGTNARSDIYSLSATLYQLMTNAVPADALTRADSMINGTGDPIQPLSELNPEISAAVSNVILKGLEVSQDKRFAAAHEMQKALRSAYAKMQGEMSAETVAFNVGSPIGADIHSAAPPVASSEREDQEPSVPTVQHGYADPIAATPIPDTPSMDATIRMDAESVQNEVRQADVKTEVFLASDLKQSSPSTPASPFGYEATKDEDDYSTGPVNIVSEPPPAAEKPFEPASTVPLFGTEQTSAGSGDEPPTPEFFQTVASTSAPSAPVSVQAEAAAPFPPVAATPKAPAKKKSKALLILAGLAAFFILIVGAAGGGWYYYENYMTGTVVTPSPSPTPEASATPEPSPTATAEPSPSPDANSATTDSNTNSNSTANDAFATPTPTPNDVTTRPTPRTTTTRDKTTGTRPPSTPTVTKPTPKPKPSNDRTVILQ